LQLAHLASEKAPYPSTKAPHEWKKVLKTAKKPNPDFSPFRFEFAAKIERVPAMKPKAPHQRPCPNRANGVGWQPGVPQMHPFAIDVITNSIT